MMILEILIAILLGCFFGIITGLTPGIHVNLISLLVFSSSLYLLKFTSPLILSIFIISMAIIHTFLDAIPSIFLGAPESDTALSVLPGHKMLLQGKGYEAVMLTLIGSFFSLIMVIMLIPLIWISIDFLYPYLERYMAIVLILASFFLIIKEKSSKHWALILFLLSGILGIATLNIITLENPLFPLLSGLFGTSTLIISLNEKTKLPKQKITFPKIKKMETSKVMLSSLVAGGLTSFLPGLGPAQGAIIGSSFFKQMKSSNFLILIGGLNTINTVLSLLALHLLNKSRNGAVVVISKLMGVISFENFLLFIFVALVVGGIGVYLTIFISKKFSILLSSINYQKLILSIIILITVLVFILSSNFLGLLILVVSTSLGIIPAKLGIGRNHLMGCLLLPTILYFIF